ncbi:MAG: glycosyltransferase family 4 protein [Victivallales bacterium]|nr:glycosyltransferase family 4 protein [Victivallales bacterium]
MRILVLTDIFGSVVSGGAGRVFFEVGRELVRRGHVVDAICRSSGEIAGPDSGGMVFHTYDDMPGGELRRLLYYWRSIRRLYEGYISEVSPDAVVLHCSSAALGLSGMLGRLDVPKVYYFHSPWHLEYELLHGRGCGVGGGCLPRCPLEVAMSSVRRRHEGKYLGLCGGVVTLSESMREVMLGVHPGVSGKPHAVIPGGADSVKFRPVANRDEKARTRRDLGFAEDDFIILTTRRLVPRTGVDVLIEAFAEVCEMAESHGRLKLVVTGSGVMEADLRRLAVDKGVSGSVIFTGHVGGVRLSEHYRCSDIFVMPTRHLEGFGLSTVEAMASGLPVVGTDVGATREILSKVSDELLIEECTSKAIAGKILEFVRKPSADIEELGRKSTIVAAEHFTWEGHAERLVEFILNTAVKC